MRTARHFAVVGPTARRARVHTTQLSCALRRARALADAAPGFEVRIFEALAPGHRDAWPIACVVTSPDGHRAIDWTPSR